MGKPADVCKQLQVALDAFDFDLAKTLTEQLAGVVRKTPSAVPEDVALSVLKALRKKRMFTALRSFAEVYFRYRHRSIRPDLRVQYAQALADDGELTAALAVMGDLLEVVPKASKDAEEARGLIGRAYKQSFVRACVGPSGAGEGPLDAYGADALRCALRAYDKAYKLAKADRFWPAINLVALLARAAAEGVKTGVAADPRALARKLLSAMAKKLPPETAQSAKTDPPWLVATGLEASLAIDDDEATVAWAKRYLACERADAFEYGSTLRQLTEIWRLHTRKGRHSATVVPILEAKLLSMRGGIISGIGASVAVSDVTLQEVWGLERFKTFDWMRRAVRCGDGVGRVEDPNGRPVGTGFLVLGRDLKPEWGDEPLFVTNRHVVNDDPVDAERNGITSARACVRFTTHAGDERDVQHKVAHVAWSSGKDSKLDVAILSLATRPAKPVPLEFGHGANLQCAVRPPSHVYVLGHPGGAALNYSLYDNDLQALEPPYLYYRSPTLGGSSGSPLFNEDWGVVGVHHSAVTSRNANCGSLVDDLRAAINPMTRSRHVD
jgi:V8-like Glu-specific endopeptidase